MTKKTEGWFTAYLAAKHIQVTDRTLRKLCKEGKLKYAKPGKKLLFHRSWLDAYVLGYDKRLTPDQKRNLEALK